MRGGNRAGVDVAHDLRAPREAAAPAHSVAARGRGGTAHRPRRRAAGHRAARAGATRRPRAAGRASVVSPKLVGAMHVAVIAGNQPRELGAVGGHAQALAQLPRQCDAARLVGDVPRPVRRLGRRLAQIVREHGIAHRQRVARGWRRNPAPASGARRCRSRGDARQAAARRTAHRLPAAVAPARRSGAAPRKSATGALPSAPRESSCQTRSAVSVASSPPADDLAHQRFGLGRDAEAEARREARDAQHAQRILGERRADVAQDAGTQVARRRRADRSASPSSSRAIALIVRSRRARSASSVTSGVA